ncbi:hypothetical protein L596_011779 [Steinernema carpocapsae]|uniref:Transmembrane protein n=1 Tax=Steinernema carpocapsae TaxID=34508 RepID=A0A4U5NVY2_STECR|nr:hypothetical protein L596_011779 [Steinernema carpocapsae]
MMGLGCGCKRNGVFAAKETGRSTPSRAQSEFARSCYTEQRCAITFSLNALLSEKNACMERNIDRHRIRRFRQLVRRPIPLVLNVLMCAVSVLFVVPEDSKTTPRLPSTQRNHKFEARPLPQ